jgi:ferredoxin
MNPIEKTLMVMMRGRIAKLIESEKLTCSNPEMIQALPDAPIRAWPNAEGFTEGTQMPYSLKTNLVVGPYIMKTADSINEGLLSLSTNPPVTRDQIEQEELAKLVALAYQSGVGIVSYTKLPHELVIQDRAVIFDSAIVLAFEIDKVAVSGAPSIDQFKASMISYDVLGKAANALAVELRQMGFPAQVSHPMGGMVLYPPLAAKAGLGKFGRHGLIITPEFGPRQRIAAVFTNITNLPFVDEPKEMNPGCDSCSRCVDQCPGQAIYEQPISGPLGRVTHVDVWKCSKQFADRNSCSVCLRECAAVNPGRGVQREVS